MVYLQELLNTFKLLVWLRNKLVRKDEEKVGPVKMSEVLLKAGSIDAMRHYAEWVTEIIVRLDTTPRFL